MNRPTSWFLALLLAPAACGASAPTVHDAPPTAGDAPPDYAAGDTLLPHQELTIDSKILAETRRINIYTPPGYGVDVDATYPVLYMPDGGAKEDFPHLTSTVDEAIRAGRIRPIVVIGIENTQRRRDLTGPTDVPADREIAPVVGGSAAFRRFVREELFPEVRRRVRGDGTTAIIGESLAGLFIVETFLLAPNTFDMYVAIDPSLQWNGGQLARSSAERFAAGAWTGKALHLSAAGTSDDDGNSLNVAPLVDALTGAAPDGLRWTYEPRPGESHSTIYRASKLAILEWLFPPG